MSGMIKVGVILTILGVVMGVTNPQSEAYQKYAAEKLLNQGETAFCEQTQTCNQDSTPGLLKDALNAAKKKVAQPALEKAIARTTERKNLILLSLYTTDIPGVGQMKTVGVFGQFLTYAK
jgi:hypothetical protein